MKPILFVFCIFSLIIPNLTKAQTILVNPLQYGMVDNPQVVLLQTFLRDQGFFSEQSTGNFFTLTQNSVKKFQQSVGIDPTGYFGPLSAAAANKISLARTDVFTVVQAQGGESSSLKTTALSTRSKKQSASIMNAFTQDELTLTWQTNNYPSAVGININLLRKVSDSPARYEFIRTIAVNTPNDNLHTWSLRPEEVTNNLYVEITCSDLYKFSNGCSVGGEPLPI